MDGLAVEAVVREREWFAHYGLDDQPLDSWADDIDEYSSSGSSFDSGSGSDADEFVSPGSCKFPAEGGETAVGAGALAWKPGEGREGQDPYSSAETETESESESGSDPGGDYASPGGPAVWGGWDWAQPPAPASPVPWGPPPAPQVAASGRVVMADALGPRGSFETAPAMGMAAVMAYPVLPRARQGLIGGSGEPGPASDGAGCFAGYSGSSSTGSGSGSDSDSSGSTSVSRHRPAPRPRAGHDTARAAKRECSSRPALGDGCACIYCGVGPAPAGGGGTGGEGLAEGLLAPGLGLGRGQDHDAKKKRKRRRAPGGAERKQQKMGRWWSGYGYEGGAYCQRCSEVFRDHLIRQKSNSARCERGAPW
jgi:hypothetical protein